MTERGRARAVIMYIYIHLRDNTSPSNLTTDKNHLISENL